MRRLALASVVLVALTLLAYAAVGDHEFTNYDDNEYVSANEMVLRGWSVEGVVWAFTRSHSANWHPVTWLSHMTDVQLFGRDAGRHHWANVGVHLLASWLLLLLAWRISGRVWISLWVALVFAVHPAHVESVAWIAERKDTLSAVFAFASLLFYHEAAREGSRRMWGLCLASFALGLMTKPMLVTLPAVFLLFDVWPLRRQDPWTQRVKEKLPFFALVAASIPATLAAQSAGRAIRDTQTLTLGERLSNAVVQWVHYVGKMLWPTDLAVFYPHPALVPGLEGPSAAVVAACALLLAAVTAATVWLARRRGWWVLPVGWLVYAGMLVPVIGIVQVGPQALADRYTYLPSIGLLVVAAAALVALARRGRPGRIVAVAVAVVSVALLLPRTRDQVEVWRDSVSLWEHTLSVTEKNWLAHNNLGNALSRRDEFARALEQYETAVRIKPDYAMAYYNRGNMLVRLGRVEEGLESYRTALRHDPGNSATMNNLGNELARQGRFDEAIRWFERALSLDPGLRESRVNLAWAYLLTGRPREARPHFESLVRREPRHVRARIGLAQVLLYDQDARALEHARRAVELSEQQDPEAMETYARALGATGHREEALQALRQAVRLFEARGRADEAQRLRAMLDSAPPND